MHDLEANKKYNRHAKKIIDIKYNPVGKIYIKVQEDLKEEEYGYEKKKSELQDFHRSARETMNARRRPTAITLIQTQKPTCAKARTIGFL
jgi:hypothetical protein